MSQGVYGKGKLWTTRGRQELERLELSQWASRRRKELWQWLDRLEPEIVELDEAVSCRPNFFLPVRVLSCLFQGKLRDFLEATGAQGKLQFSGQLTALADPARFHAWLHQLRKKDWVVYAKPPWAAASTCSNIWPAYTHRVAISNGRLLSLADDRVSFSGETPRTADALRS